MTILTNVSPGFVVRRSRGDGSEWRVLLRNGHRHGGQIIWYSKAKEAQEKRRGRWKKVAVGLRHDHGMGR